MCLERHESKKTMFLIFNFVWTIPLNEMFYSIFVILDLVLDCGT